MFWFCLTFLKGFQNFFAVLFAGFGIFSVLKFKTNIWFVFIHWTFFSEIILFDYLQLSSCYNFFPISECITDIFLSFFISRFHFIQIFAPSSVISRYIKDIILSIIFLSVVYFNIYLEFNFFFHRKFVEFISSTLYFCVSFLFFYFSWIS